MSKAIFMLVAGLLVMTGSAQAQETRVAPEGHTPPPASLEGLDWLVGQWAGQGIAGAPSMESWLPPSGGTMVGTFVQETAGEDGANAIMFTEHMYLTEVDGSLALKLKHFNADLTGWEEKDDMLTFRLVALEECAAFFSGLTLRCDGEDGLVAAVRMKSGKPEPQELVFRFKRLGSAVAAGEGSCAEAYTTIAINECLAGVLDRSNAQRLRYVTAALERHSQNAELSALIAKSDAAFATYRDSECDAVFEDWKDGSIRGLMSLTCRIDMTDKRTRTIWENWLTYPDSTPPILPEPAATR